MISLTNLILLSIHCTVKKVFKKKFHEKNKKKFYDVKEFNSLTENNHPDHVRRSCRTWQQIRIPFFPRVVHMTYI